jgi:hypothetical protein
VEEYDPVPILPGLYSLIRRFQAPGAVSLFHRHAPPDGLTESPTLSWGRVTDIHPPNPDPTHTAAFGASVALQGFTLGVGAPGRHLWHAENTNETPGNDAIVTDARTVGRAFVYDLLLDSSQSLRDLWLPDQLSNNPSGTPYGGTTNPGDLDFDGDGLSYTLELFHGLDPFNPDAAEGGFLTTALDPVTGDLVVTWREALDHPFTVTPQWSRDLGNWFADGSGPSPNEAKSFTFTTLSTHENHVIRQARLPQAGESRLHLRIKVE